MSLCWCQGWAMEQGLLWALLCLPSPGLDAKLSQPTEEKEAALLLWHVCASLLPWQCHL